MAVKALVFVAILNIAFPGSVIVVTLLAFHGSARRTFIGIFCAAVTVAMYAAPLSVMVANAIGIVSGSAQLIIYMIYKDKSSLVESEKTEVKEASIHKLEEGIKAQDMNEFDEGKLKSRSATLPKPSISRAYTINKLMRSDSMSQYESHSTFLLVP
ncbi:unnamed protein product [Ilex paraguariensis]|uniref:Uncharacterized protein n=1 Tax=Ilex paraguariensis TaxID=185542 RepID=A0ABC8RQX3_9AQUA